MRLIDADEVIERINDRYCDGCDHWNYVRCRACETDDCITEIEDSAEIDAIPVEWFCQKMRQEDENEHFLKAEYIKELIWEYHQEQEVE